MSVVLNGNTYAVSDFVGADGYGFSETFAATGLTTFPESIFTDLLAELAAIPDLDGLSFGAAGSIIVSNGSAWVRAASATITDAGAAVFVTVTTSGIINVDDTTNATSTTDGSLQTDGGVSCVKDLWVGIDARIVGDLTFGQGVGQSDAKSGSLVATTGTLDLQTSATGGGGFNGFLAVQNSVTADANIRTHTIYAVFGRGTSATFTSLATGNGSSAAAFTLTVPSNGLIRMTNDHGATTSGSLMWMGVPGG